MYVSITTQKPILRLISQLEDSNQSTIELFTDRRVTLLFDKDDIPYVYPSRAHANSRRNDETSNSNDKNQIGQIIMSIDKKRWKDIIDVFEITEAKIKRDGDEEDIISDNSGKKNDIRR